LQQVNTIKAVLDSRLQIRMLKQCSVL